MKYIIYALSLLFLFASCQPEDKYLYEVNSVDVLPVNANKTKQKTIEQFVSILYANLFQTALSADEMVEIRKVVQSIGDKELVYEILISNFMNKPGVIVPSDEEMRGDIDEFLVETYKRFYVRFPTEAEKAYMRNFIESDPNVTAELVYFSFALSNEYQFY